MGLYRIQGLGFCWGDGKENGNYYSILAVM